MRLMETGIAGSNPCGVIPNISSAVPARHSPWRLSSWRWKFQRSRRPLLPSRSASASTARLRATVCRWFRQRAAMQSTARAKSRRHGRLLANPNCSSAASRWLARSAARRSPGLPAAAFLNRCDYPSICSRQRCAECLLSGREAAAGFFDWRNA